MKDHTTRRSLRCAIYTRVSTEQGLEQDFNSLDAQREACEAYIRSQAHEGWKLVKIGHADTPRRVDAGEDSPSPDDSSSETGSDGPRRHRSGAERRRPTPAPDCST